MSTKSTKNFGINDVCSKKTCMFCEEVFYVVMSGDVGVRSHRLRPCEFFRWLKSYGDVIRITYNHSEFFDDYSFYVGSMQVDAILPSWITNSIHATVFGCEVKYVFRGGYNG